MKTMNQIEQLLRSFERQYNFTVGSQGSPEWLKLKLGVISASNASKVVSGKTTETRLGYLCDLVSQVCTGEQEEINSKYLKWGNDHEAAARMSYEFSESVKTKQVPFVFLDESFREGCSPDGIIEGEKGAEIKCPFNGSNYIKFFVTDKVKPEYQWQMQFQMRVLGCETYDAVQYHPSMKANPVKVFTFKRDEEMQKKFDDCIPEFITDMDKYLKQLGVKFGEQWHT
jgi:putative phage-type endonuclease